MPVQIIRAGWANPYIRQAVTTVVIEQVIPTAVNVANERIIPVAKSAAKEKFIPAVKNVKSKACTELGNLKRHTVNRRSSKTTGMLVPTEL